MRVKGSDPQDGSSQRAALASAAGLLAPFGLGGGAGPAAAATLAMLAAAGQAAAAADASSRELPRALSTASVQSSDTTGGPQVGATGRAQRKRKPSQVSFSNDMLPTDILARRSSKLRLQHAASVASQHPPRSRPPPVPQPPTALAAAAMPPPRPMAVKAEPSTAAPGSLAQQRPSPPVIDMTGATIMPYCLVPPAALPSALPPVTLASPWDIVQLRRQLEEVERQRASEVLRAQQAAVAEDARVVLRVLPGDQAATGGSRGGKGAKGAASEDRDGPVYSSSHRQAAAARRAARYSRRTTPEEEDSLAGLPPGTWHPGLSVADGMGMVDPLAAASASGQPPLLVVGTPPRWAQPATASAFKPQPPEFSRDPVAAALGYLRYLATHTGRLPTYGGQLQQAVNAEHRLYKERLRRAHYARDGRRLAKERVEGTRKSARARHAPEVFMPISSGRKAPKPADEPRSPIDESDSREGREFQADLPAVRPRPPVPTPQEARWLEGLLLEAGSSEPPVHDEEELQALAAAAVEERAALVEAARLQLCTVVGPALVGALGLDSMGAAYIGTLSSEEEAVLHAGFNQYGRDFHAIQAEFVPTRSVHQLINHYYNVWKLKATEQARAWFAEKEQEELAYQAEVEEAERRAEAERQRRADKQRATYERRMLREVLAWVKNAGRNPKDVNWNKPVVRERALRASRLLASKDAVPEQEAGVGAS